MVHPRSARASEPFEIELDAEADPRDEGDPRALLAVSPHDNVSRQRGPHMPVTTCPHDSQVQDLEPVTWVARLRATAAPWGLLPLDRETEAGHGGVSGRYSRLPEAARPHAFPLAPVGQGRVPPWAPVSPCEDCAGQRCTRARGCAAEVNAELAQHDR